MRMRCAVPLVAVAAGLAAWAVHSRAQSPEPERLAPPAGLAAGGSGKAAAVVGVGGCAAAGCHNAPLTPGTPGAEYGTWVQDPHGRAAATRQAKPYQDVLARITKGNIYTETLCLECHATPGASRSPSADDLLADGIGCESCHGSAERWRTEHYKNSWKTLSRDEKKALGFVPTKDLGERIVKCAECHVGNSDKDVNHDLIAAGHPRLNFEYTAYHHLLKPRHWQEPYERPRGGASAAAPPANDDSYAGMDWEVRAWLVGQAVTAKAAAELTAARAKLSEDADDRTAKQHPWPEFSEYGCFACHHNLEPREGPDLGSTWRQAPRYGKLARPGELPWGTWVRPGVEILATIDPKQTPEGPFAELLTALAGPKPAEKGSDPKGARADIAGKARLAAERLQKCVLNVTPTRNTPAMSAAEVRTLLGKVVKYSSTQADWPRDWEDAAQHYLALAALHQSLIDLDPAAATPASRDLFAGLRTVLAFPPAGDKRRYDSPADFTPEKYRRALRPLAAEFPSPEAP